MEHFVSVYLKITSVGIWIPSPKPFTIRVWLIVTLKHLGIYGLHKAVFLPVLLGDVSVIDVAGDVPVRRADALAANILKVLRSQMETMLDPEEAIPL